MIFTYRRTLRTTLSNFALSEKMIFTYRSTLRTTLSNFTHLKNYFYIPTYNFEFILPTFKAKFQQKSGTKLIPNVFFSDLVENKLGRYKSETPWV